MLDSRLTGEEQQVILDMEISHEYLELHRERKIVSRVIVERKALHRLKKACDELGVRHTSVASLLICSHNHSINESSIPWLKEIDLLPIVLLASLSISKLAATVALNMSRTLRCKKGSIATAVLQDCLPILETMPETIPGIRSLIRYPSKERRAVGIYKTTRDKISARCRLLAEEVGERLSVSSYVRTAMSTIPSAEMQASFANERFAVAVSETVNDPRSSCIDVDVGLYEYLKNLSDFLGCSITKTVSFFMEEELRATAGELQYKRSILPIDPIERWKIILDQYIRFGIHT